MRLHTRAVRTPKESLHWKLTLGRKSLAAPGNRTCVSGVPVRYSLPTELHPRPHGTWADFSTLFTLHPTRAQEAPRSEPVFKLFTIRESGKHDNALANKDEICWQLYLDGAVLLSLWFSAAVDRPPANKFVLFHVITQTTCFGHYQVAPQLPSNRVIGCEVVHCEFVSTWANYPLWGLMERQPHVLGRTKFLWSL